MMQLAALLTSLMICANGQIVFPDEFDKIRESWTNSPTSNNASAFPNPSSSVANDNGFQGSIPTNDETFYPIAGNVPSSLGSSANGQAYKNPADDREALYWSNHVNNILARGVSKFAIDMDRAIYRSLEETTPGHRPNVVFSPLSLVSTLAMVLLGSAGVTFDQVAKILGLGSGVDISSHSEIVHQMLGLMLKSIDAKANSLGPRVNTASGIFVQNGYPIRDEFKAISQQAYNSEVINLDFIGQPSESRNIVNEWVNARTRGKISGILDQPVDPDTKLIIASALYFSGEWNQFFYPRSTTRKPFAVTPNESVLVDMMYNGGTFPFYEEKQLGVKMIGLAYKGYENKENDGSPAKHQATMYVLLPTSKDAEALSRLESRLTTDILELMIGRMKNETCVIGFPKMKLSSTLNLNKALQSLGLTSLFDRRTSNLGLLSPGFNETTTSGQPSIFTRVGTDESVDTPRKNNYFRYEDKLGGYNVQQWDSGVLIEKIPSSLHRKRSALRRDNARSTRSEKTRRTKESYAIPANPTDSTRLRFVDIDADKYNFDGASARTKRQGRPIDHDFVRFIESRKTFPSYGLDSLRNSPYAGNPGLFASDVIHKVEMDVTETGTVAAAVTASTIQRGGDIKNFLANRPFLFFIRHEPSRLILFWGTVNKPTPSY